MVDRLNFRLPTPSAIDSQHDHEIDGKFDYEIDGKLDCKFDFGWSFGCDFNLDCWIDYRYFCPHPRSISMCIRMHMCMQDIAIC